MRLRAQFGDETLSRTQMYDWSKSFDEGWTEVENMWRLHLQRFLGLSRRLIHRLSDRITNQQLILLFEASYRPSKARFRSKRRGPWVKSMSPPRQRASAHRSCDNGNTEWNALEGTATSHVSSSPASKRFSHVRST
jgi:hypothetical protein